MCDSGVAGARAPCRAARRRGGRSYGPEDDARHPATALGHGGLGPLRAANPAARTGPSPPPSRHARIRRAPSCGREHRRGDVRGSPCPAPVAVRFAAARPHRPRNARPYGGAARADPVPRAAAALRRTAK